MICTINRTRVTSEIISVYLRNIFKNAVLYVSEFIRNTDYLHYLQDFHFHFQRVLVVVEV